MTTLTIVRGLPGSGKSTVARQLSERAEVSHFETDQWMMVKGVYVWAPEKLHWAHQQCLFACERDLAAGYSVVVPNTFTTFKEVRPYLESAKEIGLSREQIQIITVEGSFGSVHDVPETTMKAMRGRFDYNSFAMIEKVYNA